MKINQEQYQRLLQRLQEDFQFQDTEGEYFSRGICPSCGKRELFISKAQPWRLCCNRRDKCAFTASTYDLYKESIFANWSQHYQATPSNPNASADAYMVHARGFDLNKVQGLYTQEYFVGGQPEKSTATVRFTLSNGKAQWERFIDNVERFPGQKGRALGSFKSLWWQIPNQRFDEVAEVWITEGIFDALSLIHAGKAAIACISSGHYPSGFFLHLQELHCCPTIVVALDNDRAGQDAALKHYQKLLRDGYKALIAIPPKGKDWNDLWRNKQLNQNTLDEALYLGSLFIVDKAVDKALLMYKRSRLNHFPFEHQQKTYWFDFDNDAYQSALGNQISESEAMQQAIKITEIANCIFEPLYFQKSRDVDANYYFMKITHRNHVVQDTFTGSQMSSAIEFKKRLLSVCPGALYEGTGKQLDRIVRDKFMDLRTVESIDFCGYAKEWDAWIYRDFAIQGGKIIQANEQQFIELNRHHSLKTVSDVSIVLSKEKCDFAWVDDFWQGFGVKGMVALTFFTGTLFVNQIRQKQQSYPFLEMTGEAGTGKTTLLEFLWRLFGRSDYEGFDPNKTSFAGRARTFNKVSGLPVVLIEGDRHASHNKKFEFAELKDLYNGRPMYTRGMKTSGLETNDPPFRGSIVIAQNDRIEADEAVLSRIIPLFFTRKNIPTHGKLFVDKLNRLSVESLSCYLTYMLCHSKVILEDYFERWHQFEQRLSANEQITMTRIIHNGAQLMTMFAVLSEHLRLSSFVCHEVINFIEQICLERQQSLSSDTPVLNEFFELLNYLETLDGYKINHAQDDDLLAINLPHVESVAKGLGINLTSRLELNHLLPNTKRCEYLGKRSVRSKIMNGKVIKCMVFRLGAK